MLLLLVLLLRCLDAEENESMVKRACLLEACSSATSLGSADRILPRPSEKAKTLCSTTMDDDCGTPAVARIPSRRAMGEEEDSDGWMNE